MNILFLAHRIPYPPDKGDKIRAYNEILHFSKKHSVDVCCLVDDPADRKYIDPLRRMCRSLELVEINAKIKKICSLVSLLHPSCSCTEVFFHNAPLQKKIDALLNTNKYDLIFLYCSSMERYVRTVTNIPIVIDFVDIDSEKWRQYSQRASFPKSLLFAEEARKLARLEHRIASRVKASFLVTEKEVEFFNGNPTVHAIPNGLDTVFFDPAATVNDPHLQDQYYVEFTGAMDYFPNEDGVVWFCSEILPLIHEKKNDVQFYIVGRNPTDRVRQLAGEHVVVTGGVDDIRPYIKHAQLAVIPLRMARGIQNKILEAISMGQAVVCTSTAFEGLQFQPGRDIIVEDDPARFAKATLELLGDADRRTQMVASAQKVLKQHYSWSSNLDRMEQIIVDILKG